MSQPARYFHNSDHVFQPGEMVVPAARRRHDSRHDWHKDYSPHHVYLWHEHAMDSGDEETFEAHGRHTYEVHPVGKVEDDPEKFGEEGGDDADHAYRAPAARVIRAWCGRYHGGDYPDTWHQSCSEPTHQPGRTASADEQPVKDAHRLSFTDGESNEDYTGGSKWRNEGFIRARHPDHGEVGHVQYLRGGRVNSPIMIKMLKVHPDHQRKGYGSALMDELQNQFPRAKINHGSRTDNGKAWWDSYGKGKADGRGRTAARGQICQQCNGLGDDEHGSECLACDGSGRDPECVCGRKVTKQPGEDWWSHTDGSISHDYADGVPVDEHGPIGVADCMRMLAKTRATERPQSCQYGDHPAAMSLLWAEGKAYIPVCQEHEARGRTEIQKIYGDKPDGVHKISTALPTRRLFGPTYGLDHRLFDGECLKDEVAQHVLGTLGAFWEPLYGPSWRRWARVYLAGSEASEWTSETLEGNNDFDVLIGVDYDHVRDEELSFGGMDDEQITGLLNRQLQVGLIPHTDPVMIPIDGQETGPWSWTWFVNERAWNIIDIKPYAAWDITNHRWAVKPPHLPDWDIAKFPEGHALIQECKAVESYVRAVLKLPEPFRAQQADALWRHLHSDRGRAFTGQGEGWYDPGNVIEKYLDQKGIWEKLAGIHFDAVADPGLLDAPADWSNDPHPAAS